jgi:transposase
MGKLYKITPTNAEEARKLMNTPGIKAIVYRRLQVIALRGEGLSNSEIVKITGFADKYVPQLISKFFHNGFEPLLKDNRTGNNRLVSLKEERKFLNKYRNKAQKGLIVNGKEMWLAFNEEFGVDMKQNNFYKLLDRHNWSKKQPRKIHKKSADARTKRASKKLNVLPES